MTAAQLLKSISERDWQGTVVALATFMGWAHYHTLDSRGSNAGWPDVVLCRPPELIVVELKKEGATTTPAQQRWLDSLAACGVETAVWRPSDWPQVEARLRRERER